MLSFTNLAALFFLVLDLFLFYRYPSFSLMAEGSPKSIYDFTVKVYTFWGFPCSWVFKFWFWFLDSCRKIQFYCLLLLSFGFWCYLVSYLWYPLVVLVSFAESWRKIQFLLNIAFEVWILVSFCFIFLVPTCYILSLSWNYVDGNSFFVCVCLVCGKIVLIVGRRDPKTVCACLQNHSLVVFTLKYCLHFSIFWSSYLVESNLMGSLWNIVCISQFYDPLI